VYSTVNDRVRQVTVKIVSVNPDGQFRSVLIHILLLPDGN